MLATFREMFTRYLELTIIPSLKSLKSNLRANVPVIAAIFIVQLLLCVVNMSYANNRAVYAATTIGDCDWHIVFRGVSDEQLDKLEDSNGNFNASCTGAFTVANVEDVDLGGEVRHDVYIRLLRDGKDFGSRSYIVIYYAFMQNYLSFLTGDGEVTYSISPLYYQDAEYTFSTFWYFVSESFAFKGAGAKYETVTGDSVEYIDKPFMGIDSHALSANTLTYLTSLLIVVPTTAFIVWLMMKIKINDFKFIYGVYVTHGATSKKIFALFKWEAVFICLFTVIPAWLLSALICLVMCAFRGVSFLPKLTALPVSLIFSVILILAASKSQLTRVAHTYAVRLISASDNSDFVSSPKRSTELLSRAFPGRYAPLLAVRYRRYFAVTLSSIFVVCAVFLLGVQISDITKRSDDEAEPQFTVTFPTLLEIGMYDSYLDSQLLSLDGVSAVSAEMSQSAEDCASHVLLSDGSATNGLDYSCVTGERLNEFASLAYEGELDCADNRVIARVGEGNDDFHAGDSIKIAVYDSVNGYIESYLTGSRLFEKQLEYYSYTYIDAVVSAVVTEGDVNAGTSLYMSPELYKEAVLSQKASLTGSNLRFSEEQVADESLFSKHKGNYYTNDVEYTSSLDNYVGDEELSVGSVILTVPENYVLLSVGDKLEVSNSYSLYSGSSAPEEKMYLFSNQVKFYTFKYKGFTIAAIETDPDADGITVTFNSVDFYSLFGRKSGLSSVDVYTGLDSEESIHELYMSLRKLIYNYRYYGALVNDNNAFTDKLTAKRYASDMMTALLASLILISGSVILFFRHKLFCGKRGVEFLTLFTFGMTGKRFVKLLASEALTVCLLLAVFYAGAGSLLSRLYFMLLNPSGSLTYRYPAAAIIFGALIPAAAILTAYFATLLSFSLRRGAKPLDNPRYQS